MRPEITRILVGAWIASLAAVAPSAEITDTEQYVGMASTPASLSAPAPAALDPGEQEVPASSMPANVLEAAPRDARGKSIGLCAYDPRDRQVAAACRRRLEIAQTP